MNQFEKAILKTLAFYDILSRPLTLDELWRFLYRCRASKLQVLIATESLIKKGKIIKLQDYLALKSRENIIEDYLLRLSINRKRWQKVDWVVKIISLAPFVKMISIINSLSYNNSRTESDIDILLVAKKGRLWTARAFVVFLLEILGQNKNQWYQANKFCLGFAFDEERLDLSTIRCRNDIDFTYFLANLTPIYDKGIYNELVARNPWQSRDLPNWEKKEIKSENSRLGRLEKWLNDKYGDGLEKKLAKIQIERIWRDPKNKRKGASVIADKSMMKLHPFDKRLQRAMDWQVLTQKILSLK